MRLRLGCVLLGMTGSSAVLAGLALLPVSYYLPHEKPVLILPIDAKYDGTVAIMPMGERIMHPNDPSGHPGIDFIFSATTEKVPYIASMSGLITKVRAYENQHVLLPGRIMISKKLVDVVITEGPYQTVYSELDGESLPTRIRFGAKIHQGDMVGYGSLTAVEGTPALMEMIHWEFGSTSPLIDRFCPLTYFAPASLAWIEAVWAHSDWLEMKAQYPKICNGDYDGKGEQ